MSARFYADLPLATGASFTLPDATARHVQVLRLQPGGLITLFNGRGDGAGQAEGEFEATVTRMGRSDVDVTIGAFTPTLREAPRAVHIAVSMPANDRMDWLVEKATELGVASIQPLISERTVLRLKGERADKKVAHWRGVAIAASEQSGRNRPPVVHDVANLADWLKQTSPDAGTRLLLSLQQTGRRSLADVVAETGPLTFLSGPEGGFSPGEEAAALAAGFVPVTLGPRILRSETAPLACLSVIHLAALAHAL